MAKKAARLINKKINKGALVLQELFQTTIGLQHDNTT